MNPLLPAPAESFACLAELLAHDPRTAARRAAVRACLVPVRLPVRPRGRRRAMIANDTKRA